MGRIHRYGQTENCLIFNFVATNTVEGHILDKLHERLREIRNALDDDAVFNVVGEVLPASHIERVLREYYAGDMGDADLEDRLLSPVSEERFKAICQTALEGLASKRLNLAMLVERRARAQEKRLVPEMVARFIAQAAPYAALTLKPVAALAHSFDPGAIPQTLKRYENAADWRLARLPNRYPRLSTDRDVADKNSLEWVTPGHPLFEALRRYTLDRAREPMGQGACFFSLDVTQPNRSDHRGGSWLTYMKRITFDANSGELRLIEVKGIAGDEGVVVLTPNEKRSAEDRRDCYWLYVATWCKRPGGPKLMTIKDPAQMEWDEIRKIDHYALSVRALGGR